MKLAGRTRNVEGTPRRRAHLTTLAAAILAVPALAAALPALTGCAGFQGTRQVPLLVPVETSARRHAGPWLTPRFGPEPAVIVSWLTGQPAETRLFVGTDPGSLEERRGEGRGRLHRITLPALEPGRRYYYAPDFEGAGASGKRLYTFAAPDWNRDQAEIIVLGDLQPRDAFARRGGLLMAEAVAAAGADLVVQLGDVAEIGAFASHWLAALANLAAFTSGIPMVGVIGNHDYYGDPGRNFRSLFPYPYADPRGAFWSFEVAGAHFMMVDCFEEDGRVSDRQKAWVEADLAAAAAGGARYLFVVLHLTPLTTGTSKAGTELEGWLLPLADRAGVDAVFFGHDHHYEHWEVVYGSSGLVYDPAHRPTGRSVHYFCSGGGGAYLEIDYGLLTRKPSTIRRRLYDLQRKVWIERRDFRLPWDRERYLDHTGNPAYGQLLDGRHYYHLPEERSYQGDTGWLGYRYGEQTLHYLLIRLGPEEAVISAHYPSGELLAGPGGRHPQRFSIPPRVDVRTYR